MLTRHGWAAVGAACVSFAAGRVFALVEFFVVGAAVAVVVLVALVGATVPFPRLTTSRVAEPPIVEVDEPLRVELTVHNRGRRTTPPLELWEPVGELGGAHMQVDRKSTRLNSSH